MTAAREPIGVVVIGRNEGERLKRCLASVSNVARYIVYVDSGSSDGSLEAAREVGHDVVALDRSVPFTAARARNAGLRRLLELSPGLRYVQFVDGDCEVVDSWLASARGFLDRGADVAAVCGRLRERHPERSVYNRLCDIEWDRPVGETDACGGIAMMRVDAVVAEGGFREGLIAGEEPELCLRLRSRGWKIWRLADPMAWHDAEITRFTQWWRRAMRGGYALAEATVLHGANPLVAYRARLGRTIWWGIGLPAAILLLARTTPWSLALAVLYPLQVVRAARRSVPKQRSTWLASLFLTIAKFPEAVGVCKYWLGRASKQETRTIEYK